ncbi:ATP-binding protein [Natrialbaceae archaeon A-arb3/5]
MRVIYRFALVFLLVVLVSGAVLTITFDAHRTDVADSADESVAERADFSAAILDDRINEQKRTIALAATDPEIVSHNTSEQNATLEQFVEISAFDGATVVDETGVVQSAETASDTDIDQTGLDLSLRPYVRNALDGEQYVSDPMATETEISAVIISTPIYEDGEVVGALNGAYHLEDTRVFDPLPRDDHEAVTVQASGRTLFSDADRFDETVDESAALEAADWTVTVHQEQTQISESISQLTWLHMTAGLAVIGTITGFGAWVYRSKIRRIERLLERVRALERREYENGLSIGGTAEWRRIDNALDGLTDSLARREQMLLVLNRILRHNLRNTLNVVAGHADELESRLDGDERESAREINAATRELLVLADRARTTEDLIDPIDDQLRQIDVAGVVRDRVAAFKRTHEASDGEGLETVTVTGPDRAVAACGGELSVAIDELLANAIDHAGSNPTVTIDMDATADTVFVRMHDDGPGIPPEDAAVLTGEREISQVTHTGGIGLWLVDWIVSRYGGTLRIPQSGMASKSESNRDEPDSPDAGATVVLEIPRPDDLAAESSR